jgi:uncharacterized protein
MKKKRLSSIILLILVLLSTSTFAASAKLPEPSYDFYVYDGANIIDSDVETYIINVNKELYKKTGAQVVVATVNSLDNIDINSYATSLYEKWKIGSREYDNGILLLIAPNDRNLWIETGYGLEGQFPDSRVKRIIDNYIIPYFAEEEYSNGVVAGFNQILEGVEEEYNITLTKSTVVDDPYNSNNRTLVFNPLMIIGIIIFVFIDIKFFRGMIIYSLLRGLGRGGGGGYGGRGGGSSGGGGRSGGGGAGGSW